MNLTGTEKVAELGRDSQAIEQCLRARELENAGDYEGARVALSGFWTVVGERPVLEGLQTNTQAELLLRVGALSGWIGSTQQIAVAEAFSKDLIGEALRYFESLDEPEKVAEAQTDLAICYWRAGAMDEARVWFGEALTRASTPENRVRILSNRAIVEIFSNHLHEALESLQQCAPLLEHVDDQATRGRYHMQCALALRRLGGDRPEYLDRALIEYTAASIHLEQAGHTRYLARVENNIGFIQLQLKRYSDAIEHLDRARRIFIDLKDSGSVAQVNETRARVFLAQERYADAEHAALSAVNALEHGGEQSLLAEALTTYGTAIARTGRHAIALDTLLRAANVADTAGDPASSARTRLVIIEELQRFLSAPEMLDLYLAADHKIGASPEADSVDRLRSAARITINALRAGGLTNAGHLLTEVSLKEQVRRYEAELITRAMDQAGGQLTRAARLLGTTHQGLGEMLKSRHKNLRKTPPKPRRRSIIKNS
jgi:tetratricopeptide (TPR) repeat protein